MKVLARAYERDSIEPDWEPHYYACHFDWDGARLRDAKERLDLELARLHPAIRNR
jgi:hypothetical protein